MKCYCTYEVIFILIRFALDRAKTYRSLVFSRYFVTQHRARYFLEAPLEILIRKVDRYHILMQATHVRMILFD